MKRNNTWVQHLLTSAILCTFLLASLAASPATSTSNSSNSGGPDYFLVHCSNSKPLYAFSPRDIQNAISTCRLRGGEVTEIEPVFGKGKTPPKKSKPPKKG